MSLRMSLLFFHVREGDQCACAGEGVIMGCAASRGRAEAWASGRAAAASRRRERMAVGVVGAIAAMVVFEDTGADEGFLRERERERERGRRRVSK